MGSERKKFAIALLFFLTVFFSYAYTVYMKEMNLINERVNTSLERSVGTAHLIIGDTFHDQVLKHRPDDKQEMETIQLLSKLAENEGVTYVYSMVEDENGTLRFTASSAQQEELRTGEGLSHFFDEYQKNPKITHALQTQTKVYDMLVQDEWGNFRSLFKGYVTPDGNRYVIGADIKIGSIETFSRAATLKTTLLIVLLMLAASPIFWMYRKLVHENQMELQRQIDLKTKELRASNKEAIEAMQIAKDANKAKDIFLASMSHELRTPLNAIIGFSQILLAKESTPDAIKIFLNKIFISGKHLLTLVNSILDIAKIESGKMEVYKVCFALDELLDEVKVLTEPMAEKKNLTLLIQVESKMELFADRPLIKQVIVNLLSNAIKFSPENDRIMIRLDRLQDEDLFRICDHGKGIPRDKLETIFDPFTQVSQDQSDRINGTGLGLSIVKKIIELHEGKVWVESKEGKGSCFFFSIPSQR